MTSLTIHPGKPLRGTTTVPGDKSLTHRAIILTALAEGSGSADGTTDGGALATAVADGAAEALATADAAGSGSLPPRREMTR